MLDDLLVYGRGEGARGGGGLRSMKGDGHRICCSSLLYHAGLICFRHLGID